MNNHCKNKSAKNPSLNISKLNTFVIWLNASASGKWAVFHP